jgi:hypothetical protein
MIKYNNIILKGTSGVTLYYYPFHAIHSLCYVPSSLPTELMITMGFPKEDITDALTGQKYDETMATYLLLGRKPAEVRHGL